MSPTQPVCPLFAFFACSLDFWALARCFGGVVAFAFAFAFAWCSPSYGLYCMISAIRVRVFILYLRCGTVPYCGRVIHGLTHTHQLRSHVVTRERGINQNSRCGTASSVRYKQYRTHGTFQIHPSYQHQWHTHVGP